MSELYRCLDQGVDIVFEYIVCFLEDNIPDLIWARGFLGGQFVNRSFYLLDSDTGYASHPLWIGSGQVNIV